MKTKQYFSLAVLALLMAGCTNEETDNGKKPDDATDQFTFIGSMISEPVKAESHTRTSLDGTFPGTPGLNNVTFYWEVGDEIWLDNNQHAPADITAKNTDAKFDFTTKGGIGTERMVYYPGKNATAYNQVTIPTVQTQTAANNTEKLGENGDCGVAKATRIAYRKYKFTLKHKASYLCLLPRSANNFAPDVKVTKIKVTSDNNIAGTYTLPDDETGTLTGSGSSNTITVNATGAELSTTVTDQSKNAIYVVIAPGTHKLTLEYTIRDFLTNVEGTITKNISQKDYKENTVYPLTANLTVTEYPSNDYYMWDAADNQHYWAGHISEQPKTNYNSGDPTPTGYPQSNADSRWYNEVQGYSDDSGASPAVKAEHSCKDCPNINEILWYAKKGDPHWDADELWTTMGHLYKGGMWFKKKAHISGFNPNQAPDETVDYTKSTNYGNYVNSSVPTLSASSPLSNPNDYFYLPALGNCYSGTLGFVGNLGLYWLSTPNPWSTTVAYSLRFSSGYVGVMNNYRYFGCRRWAADGTNLPQP